MDCHNRAAHVFELPDRAVDQAMAAGEIAAGLPFVKKESVELLKTSSAEKIPESLSTFYLQKYPDAAAKQGVQIQSAGRTLAAICRAQRIRGSEGHLGNLSEQSRPHR